MASEQRQGDNAALTLCLNQYILLDPNLYMFYGIFLCLM